MEAIAGIGEAHRIRARVLAAVPEVSPSMLTLRQLEVWLEVYEADGTIRHSAFGGSRLTRQNLKVLRAIERRFYP
jgi:hypothetical protein